MTTEESQQLDLYDKELDALRAKYPGLDFEDRRNPKHLARYNEYGKAGNITRKAKRGANPDSHLRFQAIRRTVDEIDLPPMPRVRPAVQATVPVRVLVAWAATPHRLAEILATGGAR